MASASAEELLQPLKYQTWVLKVPIHCEGCKRRVKKVLCGIDGVYTTTIDSMQQKVTVTGHVKAEILIRKLLKAGKHAEILPGNVAGKQKISGKKQKNEKENDQKTSENIFSVEKENQTESAVEKVCSGPTPENVTSGENPPATAAENGRGHGGKKRKKKGQNGNSKEGSVDTAQVTDTINLGPPRHHIAPYDPAYVASYNVAYPMWSIASAPYTYAYMQPKGHSGPLDHFHIFSEENPSGCNIM